MTDHDLCQAISIAKAAFPRHAVTAKRTQLFNIMPTLHNSGTRHVFMVQVDIKRSQRHKVIIYVDWNLVEDPCFDLTDYLQQEFDTLLHRVMDENQKMKARIESMEDEEDE